ncbi:MAG: HD domain-containing protein [Bryobacteraceae bacterium]
MPRYAALDIGSNSVRMMAAEVIPGRPMEILAVDREVTRLGQSVFRSGSVSREALDSLCRYLDRMVESYRKLDVVAVRAVATAAVRDASNQDEFMQRVTQTLGAPVEIVSGQEEARLIHLGVQNRWPHPDKRILIIDIGGGSAEIILSENGRQQHAYSQPLGAIRLTEVFLKSDPPDPRELHRMEEFIEEKMAAPLKHIGPRCCDRAIATSATPAAIVCAVNRVSRSRRDQADRLRATSAQLKKLYRDLSEWDVARRRKAPGIGPRRAEIIVPGAAVLHRFLADFQLPSLYYSVAGVRDGIIADLAARGVGREKSLLSPEQRQVCEQMAQRYGIALRHVRKVAALGHTLFESLAPLHKLPPVYGKMLEAGAYLHDIGHIVTDNGHHRHSQYIVQHADMPGFTDQERAVIGNLCRHHRKSMPGAKHPDFQALPSELRKVVTQLIPLLRLADSLDRTHEQRVEGIECQLRDGSVVIYLKSSADTDLDQWAGERVAEVFQQVYEHKLAVVRARR